MFGQRLALLGETGLFAFLVALQLDEGVGLLAALLFEGTQAAVEVADLAVESAQSAAKRIGAAAQAIEIAVEFLHRLAEILQLGFLVLDLAGIGRRGRHGKSGRAEEDAEPGADPSAGAGRSIDGRGPWCWNVPEFYTCYLSLMSGRPRISAGCSMPITY